ncbi:hypothetical protein C8D92_10347 [Tamilnaduibacter salinus]|uniref:Tetratricopeptide repeat protein n=1 Tax=Tamilnaduibacter salinus TaxID=1484056 RepID=A0A2U1CXZ6_9GAMM|nr:tetratricopeptide repeat protein [Tamilnaduibacter salinus]PVY77362.1 hypothetical protein C8D92_10347 [Tamilnaduibacter salinus]
MTQRVLTSSLAIALTAACYMGGGAVLSTTGMPSPLVSAQAADNDNVRRTPAMRQNIYKRFSRIRELANQGQMAKAFESLEDLRSGTDMNSYERALMWNLTAFLHYQENNQAEAAHAYEKLLEQPNLPLSLEQDTWYSLAKLRMVLENYRGAREALNEWFALKEEPGADAYIMQAQLRYQSEAYREALESMDRAMALKGGRASDVPENWYLLQRACYYQLENYQGLEDVLGKLVAHYPKRDYLMQLSAVYGELDQPEKQLAVKEAAYEKGFLTSEQNVMSFAQLLMSQDASFRAARVIEKAIDEGQVPASTQNLRQLGDAWLLAKEYDSALKAMGQAAEQAGDGSLYFRMAQVSVDLGRWEDAETYSEKAIAVGGLDSPGMAHVLNGLALFNQDAFDGALSAFQRASDYSATRNMAQQWQEYVRKSQKRQQELEASIPKDDPPKPA